MGVVSSKPTSWAWRVSSVMDNTLQAIKNTNFTNECGYRGQCWKKQWNKARMNKAQKDRSKAYWSFISILYKSLPWQCRNVISCFPCFSLTSLLYLIPVLFHSIFYHWSLHSHSLLKFTFLLFAQLPPFPSLKQCIFYNNIICHCLSLLLFAQLPVLTRGTFTLSRRHHRTSDPKGVLVWGRRRVMIAHHQMNKELLPTEYYSTNTFALFISTNRKVMFIFTLLHPILKNIYMRLLMSKQWRLSACL